MITIPIWLLIILLSCSLLLGKFIADIKARDEWREHAELLQRLDDKMKRIPRPGPRA